MPVAQVQNSLVAGVFSQFQDMWRQKFPVFKELQEILLFFVDNKASIPDNARKKRFVWKDAIPFPRPWPYASERVYEYFKDRVLEVSIYPWQLNIPFSLWDEEDDQIGDLRQHVSMAAERFLQLPDPLISEYLNGVRVLNYELANAYDGVGLFSALDGDGAARFRATGGNIVVGSGTSEAAISGDLARVQQRFLTFRDPAGFSPIFSPSDADYTNMHIIYPNALNEPFQKLAEVEQLRVSLANNVSEGNRFKSKFTHSPNPYLTSATNYFVVLKHNYWKGFVYRHPGEAGLRQIFQDYQNSDRARNVNEAALLTDIRVNLAPWAPFTLIKVTN